MLLDGLVSISQWLIAIASAFQELSVGLNVQIMQLPWHAASHFPAWWDELIFWLAIYTKVCCARHSNMLILTMLGGVGWYGMLGWGRVGWIGVPKMNNSKIDYSESRLGNKNELIQTHFELVYSFNSPAKYGITWHFVELVASWSHLELLVAILAYCEGYESIWGTMKSP